MAYITGSRLKVRRAGKHLHELERKADSFLKRNPDKFTKHLDPQDFNYLIYEIQPNPAPPATFGPVFGDVVHNLRSALDHIAWQLALLNLEGTEERPYWNTAFPILTDKSRSSARKFKRLTKDVLRDAIPVIKALQPYHRREAAGEHELAILDALWNADKHRANIAIPSRQYVPVFEPDRGGVECLPGGARRMRVPRWSKPEEKFEPYLRSEVMFEIPDPDSGPRVSLAVLRQVYEFVRDDVVPQFARFLPESTGLVERVWRSRQR